MVSLLLIHSQMIVDGSCFGCFCFVAEDQLARIYDHGTIIARLHRNITDAVLGDHYIGGSFEGWWKNNMSESAQRNLLEVALDAASNAGGGYGFGIRLK